MLSIRSTLGTLATGPHVAYLASYPPRECGIATFTRDLVTAVDKHSPLHRGQIIAVNDPGRSYDYPPCVKYQIQRDNPHSYDEAAEYVNDSRCQVVNIQHEYGLFGGTWGSYLFRFLDRLARPVSLTLHTVLPSPDPTLREVTRGLIARSERTIVLAESATDILERDYRVDRRNVLFIPHGVPNVRPVRETLAKRALGLTGRPILATCGLMNPGKGIEYAIQAVAGLVEEFPDVLYLVVGETHPGVRTQTGESYREQLQDLVRQLNLEKHVRFHNKYLKYRELVLYLLASDVYVVPYLDLNQIVSGTLAYAVGCGRAIVSTPSAYALEVLAEARGLLAPVRDPEGLRIAIGRLLRNREFRADIQQRAYAYGHKMVWSNVARAYADVFEQLSREAQGRVRRLVVPAPSATLAEVAASSVRVS